MHEVLIVGIVFLSVVAVIKIITDSITRRKLIEREAGDNRTSHFLMGHPEHSALSNLKWGMVLVGIGLAALLSHWLPYHWSEEGAIGLIFVFAGLGFLIYYPIARKRLREIERNEHERQQLPRQ